MAVGRCSVVVVLNVQPSSENVRIKLLHDGKPVRDVKIEVLMADEQPRLSLTTNEHGAATLPTLPPGRYHIVATAASGGLGADLVLDVSKSKKKKTSLFSMDLFVRPPPPPALADKIAVAEGIGPGERLQEFQGAVSDPSGAVAQGAKVAIFQRGSLGKAQVARTTSDATGHFSAHLEDGSYTAIFQLPGFSTQIQVFEIAGNGDKKDLQIVLQVASCT
jgi:hypothetical protein